MTGALEVVGPPALCLAMETAGRAAVVRFGPRGARTTLPLRLRAELGRAVEAAGRDQNTYCALVEGQFELADEAPSPTEARDVALAAAYRGVWAMDRFGKPLVSLIEGEADWSGFSMVINGTHKVADPGTTFGIREFAATGLPGWGASHHLPALPGHLGLYLAMTGARIDSALAYRLGWLTHRIPAGQFAVIKAKLATAEPVDAVLDDLDLGPAASPLDPYLGAIERCFSPGSPQAIRDRLDGIAAGANADWAVEASAAMRRADPRLLSVLHRLLTSHDQPTLRGGLIMDYRIALNWARVGAGGDLETVLAEPAGGDLVLDQPSPPSID